MDEDEPGAVDARSIYIGNVRTHLALITSADAATPSKPTIISVKSVKPTNGSQGVWRMNLNDKYLS
jgi:hypothetical protein